MRASIITLFYLSFISCEFEKNQNVPHTNIDDPIAQLTELLQSQPDDLGYLQQRGSIYLERGQNAEAIADLVKVYAQNANVVTGHLLADAYLDAQQSRIALETLHDVVQKNPSSLQSKLKLSEFQLICKQYAKAHQTLQSIRRQDPENAEAFFMDGLIYEEEEDQERALSAYQNATKSDPELLDAWIHTGQLLDRRQDPDADRYYTAALAIQPDHIPTLHARAISLTSRGNVPDAKKTYHRILRSNPDYTEAYFNLGLIYFDQDSIAAARSHFNLSVKTDPQFVNGYFYRGLAAEFMEDLESARLDFAVALRLNPKHEKALAGMKRVTPPE